MLSTMKLATFASAIALMGTTVEARRGGGRRGGFNPLAVLEACQEELSFDCETDVAALINDITELKENGQQFSDDVRADLENVRQCIGSIRDDLVEGSACSAALSGRGGGKGGKGGKGGRRPVCEDESIPACADGSEPTRGERGEPPVCASGANPVCEDGSSPVKPERPQTGDTDNAQPRQRGRNLRSRGGNNRRGGNKRGGRPVCADASTPACFDGSEPTKAGRGPPVCADETNPVCADGSAPEKPEGGNGRRPTCADESRPACADGSTPTKVRGEAPVCADGTNPVCADGSAPVRPEDGADNSAPDTTTPVPK